MLTGMASTWVEKSVPWSRLNPRRKYWLAFPLPECWVATSPGTNSRRSPARCRGRSAISPCPTEPCDAEIASPTRFSRRPSTCTVSSTAASAAEFSSAARAAFPGSPTPPAASASSAIARSTGLLRCFARIVIRFPLWTGRTRSHRGVQTVLDSQGRTGHARKPSDRPASCPMFRSPRSMPHRTRPCAAPNRPPHGSVTAAVLTRPGGPPREPGRAPASGCSRRDSAVAP